MIHHQLVIRWLNIAIETDRKQAITSHGIIKSFCEVLNYAVKLSDTLRHLVGRRHCAPWRAMTFSTDCEASWKGTDNKCSLCSFFGPCCAFCLRELRIHISTMVNYLSRYPAYSPFDVLSVSWKKTGFCGPDFINTTFWIGSTKECADSMSFVAICRHFFGRFNHTQEISCFGYCWSENKWPKSLWVTYTLTFCDGDIYLCI